MTPLINGFASTVGNVKSAASGLIDKVASYGIGQYGEGNIDLYDRPKHVNEDGSVSTVKSSFFGVDDKFIVVPTVMQDGSVVQPEAALDNYFKTGQYLGKFNTEKQADTYARRLHLQQERIYPAAGGGSIWQ